MSHSPSNGNPFSLVWSISLRREACRHAELNPWRSFSKGRTSRWHSRWKDWNGEQKKQKKGIIWSFWDQTKKKIEVFSADCVPNKLFFSNDCILMQSVVSTVPWVTENGVSSLNELSDLNEKSRESSRIWGKMQIHGSLIFTYTRSQGELDFEAGLLV